MTVQARPPPAFASQGHASGLRHRRHAAAILTVGAQAATADGFARGDVLASVGNPSVIARFAPDGTAKGALADSAGAGPLCFDPSGEHLMRRGPGSTTAPAPGSPRRGRR